MKKKKPGGRKQGSRRRSKLTPSQSKLKNSTQVEHLDPTSDLHLIDVASAERQRNEASADAATAEVALLNKVFTGYGLRPDLVANIWFGDAGVGFPDLDGHDGSAVVMEGKEWQRTVVRADTGRFKWRDASDKLRRPHGLELLTVRERPTPVPAAQITGEGGGETPEVVPLKPVKGPQMSGQLAKIYARLAPWVAVEAGKELTREKLVEVAARVARAFQAETSRRVLAANIHVENDHDIHLHLTFTALVPEISQKNYSGDHIKKILAKQRKQVKHELLSLEGKKPSRIQIQERLDAMYEADELINPALTKEEVIYRRLPRPQAKEGRRHLLSMGPAYCSKTMLWEASGRDPQVAGINENALAKAFSFGEVVMSKVKKSLNPKVSDRGPEDHYIDYWLWKTWKAAVEETLSDKTRELLPALARPFVQRYIQDGRSLPNPVLDAARKRAVKESLGALDKARQTLAGSDVSPTAATTIPELVGEISQLLVEKEENAVVRGLKQAFAMIFQGKKPSSNGSENLERAIKKGISKFKLTAVVSAWKEVYGVLFPGVKPKGVTPTDLKNEVLSSIVESIRSGYQAVLNVIEPGTICKAPEFEGMKVELLGATDRFRQAAIINGLDEARRELLGPDAGEAPASEEAMRSAIRDGITQKSREAEQNAMALLAPIPVRTLAEKLGFKENADGELVVKIECSGEKILHRIETTEERFKLSILSLGNKGGTWELRAEGHGAIGLMKSLTKDPTVNGVCEELAKHFPDQRAAIILELSARANPKIWGEIVPPTLPKNPQDKEVDPKKF